MFKQDCFAQYNLATIEYEINLSKNDLYASESHSVQ